MNNELRTINDQLNTSDEQQATCDEFAPFWSFYVIFCTFCASLRLKRTVFTRLLKKAISMALWTKACLYVKSSLLEQSLPRTPSRQKTSIISVNPVILSNFSSCPNVFVAKNPRNLRNPRLNISSCSSRLRLLILAYLSSRSAKISVNPWLINDLRLFKALYICRETFTDVMSALQIKLFMQNEPKFRKSQMNVNKVLTREYEQMDTWLNGKNEPKTNPKRTQNEPN